MVNNKQESVNKQPITHKEQGIETNVLKWQKYLNKTNMGKSNHWTLKSTTLVAKIETLFVAKKLTRGIIEISIRIMWVNTEYY